MPRQASPAGTDVPYVKSPSKALAEAVGLVQTSKERSHLPPTRESTGGMPHVDGERGLESLRAPHGCSSECAHPSTQPCSSWHQTHLSAARSLSAPRV